MSEKLLPPEQQEISDDQLVATLMTGIERSDVRAVLEKWTEQEEKKVLNDPVAVIEFNRRRARLYRKSGYVQEALDVLQDAATQAWNERRDELYNDILTEQAEIEDSNI